jgi:hypothetical protein
MPDHINIHHPDGRAMSRQKAVTIAELRAKISTLETYLDSAESDLEAIFTRIKRGDAVELHMPNGAVFIVTGKERK